MHLNPHSLQQIDDAYIESLDPEALRGLSLRLLADFKEAWDRLNQEPENSSRPPSSRAPWERRGGTQDAEADAMVADGTRDATGRPKPTPAETPPADDTTRHDPTGPQTGQTTGGAGDWPNPALRSP